MKAIQDKDLRPEMDYQSTSAGGGRAESLAKDCTRDAPITPQLQMVRDWIMSTHPEGAAIGLDTDLIESRLIDSLQFAEFLFRLEEIKGSAIDLDSVSLDTFRTLRTIQRQFFMQA